VVEELIMMKYKIISLQLIVLLIVPVSALAGTGDQGLGVNNYLRSGGVTQLGMNPLGFLNPSRMTFNTSYSMAYATSGNNSLMQGLFMETIGYRLSNPLSLTLNLGFQHTPYSTVGPDGLTRSARFVGGAALNWRPTENMFLHFEVANYPSYGSYGYNPYWGGYPYSSPLQIQNYQDPENQESQSK
jgi:hypothetical protein